MKQNEVVIRNDAKKTQRQFRFELSSRPSFLLIQIIMSDSCRHSFDNCYWSHDRSHPDYASQETVFQDLGMFALSNAFAVLLANSAVARSLQRSCNATARPSLVRAVTDPHDSARRQGYNVCLFAYGQTGSGKSFSMVGSEDDPGIIPRVICMHIHTRLRTFHMRRRA